jgi:hypothetical protein
MRARVTIDRRRRLGGMRADINALGSESPVASLTARDADDPYAQRLFGITWHSHRGRRRRSRHPARRRYGAGTAHDSHVGLASIGPSVVGGLRSVEKTRSVIEKLLGDVIVVTVCRH